MAHDDDDRFYNALIPDPSLSRRHPYHCPNGQRGYRSLTRVKVLSGDPPVRSGSGGKIVHILIPPPCGMANSHGLSMVWVGCGYVHAHPQSKSLVLLLQACKKRKAHSSAQWVRGGSRHAVSAHRARQPANDIRPTYTTGPRMRYNYRRHPGPWQNIKVNIATHTTHTA
jgi:hypothetical protein